MCPARKKRRKNRRQAFFSLRFRLSKLKFEFPSSLSLSQPLSLLSSFISPKPPPQSAPALTTPAKKTTSSKSTSTIASALVSKLSLALSSAKNFVVSLPSLPPATSPDLFRSVLSSAPVSKAKSLAASTSRRLAHPSPGILTSDRERHLAIYVLGAALLVWVAAAVAGAAAGDGGACVAFGKGISSSSSLSAAASCVRGGRLPLLWFDGALRKLGPLLPLPLLLSRAAVAHSPVGGSIGGRSSRPAAHFIHVAFIYAAAAATRLAVYLPHRAGVLGKVLSLPAAAFARVVGGGAAAVAPRGLRARAGALAARAAAAPITSLLPFSSSSSSSKDSAATHHLMSDHLFLGACVGAVLCAEGVLLVSDARRHGSGSNKTRARLLLAGAAVCALLYSALCLDMAFTAAYFHARHESAAAVVAGLVAFQAPLALWLLGGVKEAKKAVVGAVGGFSLLPMKKKSLVRSRSSSSSSRR